MGEDSGLSLAQEKALALTPKFNAPISIACSIYIIYESLHDHRVGKGTVIQRALMGMACIDIMASFGWFLNTWAVPEGTALYAAGNRASCNFQGFLLQLAIGAPLYNGTLALYYLLIVKYNYTDASLRRIEPWVHTVVLTFAIGTSILGLFLGMYNSVGNVCWVIGEPEGCGHSSYTYNPDEECERGDYAWIFGLGLFYGPLWIVIFFVIVAMAAVYLFVRQTFNKLRRYAGADAKKVEKQAQRAQRKLHRQSWVRFWTTKRTKHTAGLDQPNGIDHHQQPQHAHVRGDFDGHDGSESSDSDGYEDCNDAEPHQHDQNLRYSQSPKPQHHQQSAAESQPHLQQNLNKNVQQGLHSPTHSSSDTTTGQTLSAERNDVARVMNNATHSTRGTSFVSSGDKSAAASSSASDGRRQSISQPQSRPSRGKTSTVSDAAKRETHRVATQAFLYSVSFLVTWAPSTVWSIAHWFNVSSYAVDYLAALSEPLQGFWNCMIFIYHRERSAQQCQALCKWLTCNRWRCSCLDNQEAIRAEARQQERLSRATAFAAQHSSRPTSSMEHRGGLGASRNGSTHHIRNSNDNAFSSTCVASGTAKDVKLGGSDLHESSTSSCEEVMTDLKDISDGNDVHLNHAAEDTRQYHGQQQQQHDDCADHDSADHDSTTDTPDTSNSTSNSTNNSSSSSTPRPVAEGARSKHSDSTQGTSAVSLHNESPASTYEYNDDSSHMSTQDDSECPGDACSGGRAAILNMAAARRDDSRGVFM